MESEITELLEKFRDMNISKNELDKSLPLDIKKVQLHKPITVCRNHVIELLERYRKGDITESNLLDWVNIIWFSDAFDYRDDSCDSIASIMNELEEIDEEGKELTNEKIERFIVALRNNSEIE